jgi:hypothetical protein
VRLARLKSDAQGHASTQNVLLTDHLAQCLRPQTFR